MIICQCRVISDKTVREKLNETCGRARVSDIYKKCSGGEQPQCGSCVSFMRDQVVDHNRKQAVSDLRKAVAAPKKTSEIA